MTFASNFALAQSQYDHAEPDWCECDCDEDCPPRCPCQDPRCLCGAENDAMEREYWAERRAEERREERGW